MRKIAFLLLFLVLLGLAFAAFAAFRTGPPPRITIAPAAPGIGKRTPVAVTVEEPDRGVAGIRVELVQNGGTPTVLAEKQYVPVSAWRFWGPRTAKAEIPVVVGSETVPGLKTGEATIRVVAERAPGWIRTAEPETRELTLPVRLSPPSLMVLSTQTYVAQGGSEVVVYRVGEGTVRDGVEAGTWFFPGRALPGGGPNDRFALFGIPWDMGEVANVRLVAADALGNTARQGFVDKFFPKPFGTDDIPLDDRFLAKVTNEIMGQTPGLTDHGSLLANYLEINRNLRKQNGQTLIDLAAKSKPEFLWNETFLPLANSAVMSKFADHRLYMYNGQQVDEQFHLGFDLAALAQTPIPAANRGEVVLARYFGIYGNCVVIDHGFGLMSLYGHLSSIDVQEGQTVARGAVVGKSGATGLAGGDHLHFTMLLDGLPVNPVEWWDTHWIADRLKRKLGAAIPFGAPGGAAG